MSDKPYKSALHVQGGVPQPADLNQEARARYIGRKRTVLPAATYYAGIRAGDRALFSQAITLIESTLPEHREVSQEIIALCLPHSGHSVRIGITGVPGVGKSTFIDAFGMHLVQEGHKVAVLAVDPSSGRSKGSILGDKTRMEELSRSLNAFIRPSPSAGSLGGVARKTRESIIVCEAAGFDVMLVETVGVGQSETAVHGMVDFFLLLMLSGAGDELQGIKRGIMEMCDAIFINKADGDNKRRAEMAKVEYANALHLFPASPSGWTPTSGICSALTGEGIEDVWKTIQEYKSFTTENQYFNKKRQEQNLIIIRETVNESLLNRFYKNPKVEKTFPDLEQQVMDQKITAYQAAKMLLEVFDKG
jgi:LAO/AO transport system kinase